jgi:glutathione S-transferase
MAIARYFEETNPEPPLMGIGAKDKAIVDMWEKRANEEGMLPASELFRNTHPKFAERGLPGATDPIPAIPELCDRGRSRLARFFGKFDRQLADNPFVAGERFTVADATTLAAVDFAGWSDVGIPRSCRHLQRWYDTVSQRPSARA